MDGVILIRKEKAYTSFDVVAVVRRLTGQRKVGHTGTLDPNATGVLPVLLGTATKAQDIIPCHDKKYLADFKLGVATDTLDIWGTVTEEKPARVSKDEIEKALRGFRGEIEQVPPMYSAVSVDGKRLYRYAREGRTVERPTRSVTVYSLALQAFDEATQTGRLDIHCSGGTYVRTLIDDLARTLGTVGVMTDLLRYEACGYPLDDCMTLDELKGAIERGDTGYLHSVESIFMTYDALEVSDKQANRFQNGNPLELARTALRDHAGDQKIVRVRDRQGCFLSLGITDGEALKVYKHF
ncbi:tRNA pseudouridine(55) synthase TruB [Ruminococcus sp.]|uniref:tRNA pseudouridine(55) synthase TruB n=1 Tax=Ruminococcus sp. TaxID=41978 RepID=UPI00388D9635